MKSDYLLTVVPFSETCPFGDGCGRLQRSISSCLDITPSEYHLFQRIWETVYSLNGTYLVTYLHQYWEGPKRHCVTKPNSNSIVDQCCRQLNQNHFQRECQVLGLRLTTVMDWVLISLTLTNVPYFRTIKNHRGQENKIETKQKKLRKTKLCREDGGWETA